MYLYPDHFQLKPDTSCECSCHLNFGSPICYTLTPLKHECNKKKKKYTFNEFNIILKKKTKQWLYHEQLETMNK